MIGVVSEGPSDRDVLREIGRKAGIEIRHRLMRGNDLVKARSYSFLLFREGCGRVIILKDLHRSTAPEIRKRFKEARFTGEVTLCIAVEAMESWLLADEEAIGNYIEAGISPIFHPEEIERPDEYLDMIFKKAKDRHYIKGGKDAFEIAKRLRLKIVEQKCPSFKEFFLELRN